MRRRGNSDVAMRFYSEAMRLGEKAVMLDRKRDLKNSIDYYAKSVEYFLAGLRRDRVTSRSRAIKNHVKEYLNRAEKLKGILHRIEELNRHRAVSHGGNGASNDLVAKRVKQLFDEAAKAIPNVKWDDVAGAGAAKDALEEAVVLPLRFPSIFKDGRTPWKGILMFGPPGTGKTHLAKALANRSKHKLVAISASDLMSKYQGESEKMIRAVMEEARKRKPCIIFIDEIDSVGRKRKEDENESMRRIKNELLKQMDGIGSKNEGVVVLAATNAPWEIDSALRRRFEKRVFVDLPEMEARLQILKIHLEGEPMRLKDSDFTRLANQTKGYSGSDLSSLCREALMVRPHTNSILPLYYKLFITTTTTTTCTIVGTRKRMHESNTFQKDTC
jgi:vacuolar protein-sorting-associated protein 4